MTNDALAVPAPPTEDTTAAPVERPTPAPTTATRPPADRLMRRLLLIRDNPTAADQRRAYGLFSTSILISATRCVLSYVIFPIFAPFLYAASSAGPAIGLTVGVTALVFDVLSIRRFWAADHRYRWPMTAIYVTVIALVSTLLVQDFARVFGGG